MTYFWVLKIRGKIGKTFPPCYGTVAIVIVMSPFAAEDCICIAAL